MNCPHKKWGLEVQFDRLVDGEMSPDEYRSFVQSLDQQSDGWKRLALAFLESQAWRQEIPVSRVAESATGHVVIRSEGPWWKLVSPWGVVAASIALAFSFGVWFSRPEFAWPASFEALAGDGGLQALTPITAAAPNFGGNSLVSGGNRHSHAPPPHASPDEVEFVVAGNDGDWRRPTTLPIRSIAESNAPGSWDSLWSTPQIVEMLRKSGREVNHGQQIVPYVLSDGREVLMPVERVEVKPAKIPSY